MSAHDKLVEELTAHFKMIDENKDGFITKEELKKGLLKFGISVDDSKVETMIKNADTDKDGKINYDEFLVIMGAWFPYLKILLSYFLDFSP